MARKVFLSFLGTNRYIKTKYYLNEECKKTSQLTHFVQETTIGKTCLNWSSNDKVFIFLTEDAKTKNWESPAQKNNPKGQYTGLAEILEALNLNPKVQVIDIPDGFSEEEIWNIFVIIFRKLKDDDELYIDITHAFRFFPLLMIVIFNYAKVVLNITVKHIYYGAFEKLGPAYMVENDISEEERYAPILDLASFSELQEWSNAANSFVKFGSSELITELTKKEISPILKYSQGKDEKANQMRKFTISLFDFTQSLKTNRGLEILEGNKAKN